MKRSLVERLIEMIVVPAVLGLIAVGFASICLRYLFEGAYALFWSEELIRYGFIWVFWLVSPLLVLSGATFSVDMFTGALPETARTVLKVVMNLAVLGLLGIYVYQGLAMARVNWTQLSTALEVPIGWFYLAIPAGSAAMAAAVIW